MATSPTPTPEPPASIPQYILDGLDRQDAQTLQEISHYAEDLAAAKEAAAEAELEDDDEVVREDSEDVDDLPNDVPTKASIVVKNINSNRYYYYQWREGSKVKSKYKAPVNPDSDD